MIEDQHPVTAELPAVPAVVQDRLRRKILHHPSPCTGMDRVFLQGLPLDRQKIFQIPLRKIRVHMHEERSAVILYRQ